MSPSHSPDSNEQLIQWSSMLKYTLKMRTVVLSGGGKANIRVQTSLIDSFSFLTISESAFKTIQGLRMNKLNEVSRRIVDGVPGATAGA